MPLPINNHIKPGHRNLLHSALSHHHNWSSSPSKKGGSQNRENDQLDGSHWGFSQPSDLPVVSEIVRHTTGNGCPMSVPGGSCCQQWPLNPSSSFPPKAPDLKIGQASEKTAWIMWSKQERDGGLEGNLPYCISIPKKKRKSLKKGRGWRNSTKDAPSPGTKKNRGYSKKGLAILNAHHGAAATASGRWQCSDSDPGPLLVGAWQSERETEQEGVTFSVPPTNGNLQGCCFAYAS